MSRVSYAMMNPGGDVEMTHAVRERDQQPDPRDRGRGGHRSRPDPRGGLRLQPGDAPPAAGHRPGGAGPGALRARHLQRPVARRAGAGPDGDERTCRAVYILPCIAGHVGADAAAVALSEAPDKSQDLVLVVDVGTNAEILLGNKNRVLACSSPTGPAFEGAQISSGQRAAPGAIERVEIDPVTKEPRFSVIGQRSGPTRTALPRKPRRDRDHRHLRLRHHRGGGRDAAWPGSSIASGLIGSAEQTGTARCMSTGRTHAYVIHDGEREGGPRITVTQGDIRAIQLAKSALYAGARLLMDEMGVDTVDRIVLAGAFGAHISPEARDGAGHDPRRTARQGDLGRQRRRHGRAHRALQRGRAGGDRGDGAADHTRSKPRSSRNSRSISSMPPPFRTRSIPSRS